MYMEDTENAADWSALSVQSWNALPLPFPRSKDGGIRPHHQNCPLFRPSSRFSSAGVPVCQRGTNYMNTKTLRYIFSLFQETIYGFLTVVRAMYATELVTFSAAVSRATLNRRGAGNVDSCVQNKSAKTRHLWRKRLTIGENTTKEIDWMHLVDKRLRVT